ncbi:MAG: ABC transporter ATP-binding protein [Opitutaceae bacterium]
MPPPTPAASPPPQSDSDVVLELRDLQTYFQTEEGVIRAVDGVSLELRRGRILAIVGESGCGKSVTSHSILRLIQRPGWIAGGRILLRARNRAPIDITALNEKSDTLYEVRGGLVSMIFQEPMTALSPVHTIGNQIIEAIRLHQNVTHAEARARSIEMLRKVGIAAPERRIDLFPHELSGGMRQRAVIAMALVCRPEVLIADEPTTALDVTIQAQILGLIRNLQEEIGCSVLLITHNMGVVAQTADEVAVMYLGRVVEHGAVDRVLKAPRHPYTIGLMQSIPGARGTGNRLPSIKGSVPALTRIPRGCPFHPRCDWAQAGRCDVGSVPELRTVRRRLVACHRAEEIMEEAEGACAR